LIKAEREEGVKEDKMKELYIKKQIKERSKENGREGKN